MQSIIIMSTAAETVFEAATLHTHLELIFLLAKNVASVKALLITLKFYSNEGAFIVHGSL